MKRSLKKIIRRLLAIALFIPLVVLLTLQGVSLYRSYMQSLNAPFQARMHADYLYSSLKQYSFCLQNFPSGIPIPPVGQIIIDEVQRDGIKIAQTSSIYRAGKKIETTEPQNDLYQLQTIALQQGNGEVYLYIEYTWKEESGEVRWEKLLIPIPQVFDFENGVFKCHAPSV